MKISSARTAAFDVLFRIETEKAFSSSLLPIYEESLSTADSGLCHELVLGSLRRQMYLDRVIDGLTGGKRLDPAVRIAARLGLYQLLFLDKIPAYSAINESVLLVQRAKKTSAKGFVNAILRRTTREKIELKFVDDIERLCVETSHPRWLIERWITQFGAAETELIAAANNVIPRTGFRLLKNTADTDPQKLDAWQRSELTEGVFVTERIDQGLRDLETNGTIYFQDEASQIIARSVVVPLGGSFLDVCAAPGGKTGLIASLQSGTINLAVAGDLHRQRVDYLRDNCARQGMGSVSIIQYDAEYGLPFANETFDTVLVDAPCSGTGTIRHNPELRYLLVPIDLVDLPKKQLNILKNASKTVKRGGSLIYSTCSLETEENESVVQAFLAGNVEFQLERPKIADRFMTADKFGRTWPHTDKMDGFFVAKLVHKT